MHGLPGHLAANTPNFLPLMKTALATFICLLPLAGQAQDEAFLRCVDFADRTARVLCLEDALEAAVKARDAAQGPSVAPLTSAQPAPPTAPVAGSVNAEETAASEDTHRFDLFGLFDREQRQEEARAEEEQRAAETMHAKISDLRYYKSDVWTITLDNGQVWRQLYARRFNLREGDAISIYQSGWGDQFRLEVERFDGFIQVQRLR